VACCLFARLAWEIVGRATRRMSSICGALGEPVAHTNMQMLRALTGARQLLYRSACATVAFPQLPKIR